MHEFVHTLSMFHLMEVHAGKGLHNGYVPQGMCTAMQVEFREVINQCRSKVGKKKRWNAQKMQVRLQPFA
jgi:Leu/Phe-tRNA-protein transferase